MGAGAQGRGQHLQWWWSGGRGRPMRTPFGSQRPGDNGRIALGRPAPCSGHDLCVRGAGLWGLQGTRLTAEGPCWVLRPRQPCDRDRDRDRDLLLHPAWAGAVSSPRAVLRLGCQRPEVTQLDGCRGDEWQPQLGYRRQRGGCTRRGATAATCGTGRQQGRAGAAGCHPQGPGCPCPPSGFPAPA